MKSIIIGFSHPAKFSLHAWIIEKIDGAPFDHAYIRIYSDTLNRDIVYQANWKGVGFISLALWRTTTIPVEEYKLPISDDNYRIFLQFCVDNAGISYGLLGVIGAGIVDIAQRIFKRKISNPFNDGLASEFCSEIIARCLNVADPTQFNLDADNITPNDLNSIIKQLNITHL